MAAKFIWIVSTSFLMLLLEQRRMGLGGAAAAAALAFVPPVASRRPSSLSSLSSLLSQRQQLQRRQQSRLLLAASSTSSSIAATPAYNAAAPPPPSIRSGNNGPLKSGTTLATSSYKHLFRHVEDISLDCWLRVTEAREFLRSVGYARDEIEVLARDNPKILTMSVHDVLAPKVRFLVTSLGAGTGGQFEWMENDDNSEQKDSMSSTSTRSELTRADDDECRVDYDFEKVHHSLRLCPETRRLVPASFFAPQLRLEKTLAPRHAYLQFFNLPHTAQDLLYFQQGNRFRQFLDEGCSSSSKTSAANFATLCTKLASRHLPPMGGSLTQLEVMHTTETVRAMERVFAAGLLQAAKNIVTPDLKLLDMTPGQLVELLVSHGANTMESDSHGVSLLHWAAGTGNLVGLQALLQKEVETTASLLLHDDDDENSKNMEQQDMAAITQVILLDDTTKDGSTPMHWAACGVGPTGFCAGGHAHVCRYLLQSVSSSSATVAINGQAIERAEKIDNKAMALANAKTDIGTTPIMLAAWSGSLETVQVLIQYGRANPHATNIEGYNAAHFAASAGHLHVCQYLHQAFGMDFAQPVTAPAPSTSNGDSDSGSRKLFTSPLQSAMAYDRKNVVEWIQATFLPSSSSS